MVRPRVLVGDDQPANILLVVHALKDEFDVLSVTSGQEILDGAATPDVDLILLDVDMPGLDGFEVCRRLKTNPQTASIPVIFLTGRDTSSDEALGFDVGGVDYIAKPIRPAIVRARVRTHLELKRARDLLEQAASVDQVTGIANRRRFDDALDLEWRRASRGKRWLSLAIADVDEFKRFNDAYGHLKGDVCLRAIATTLDAISRRPGDLAARYGGEEFGLLFSEIDARVMRRLLSTLVEGVRALAIPHEPSPCGRVTVSVGAISVVASREGTALECLEAADRLLYEAKQSGRDRCVHLDMSSGEKTAISASGNRVI